MEFPIIQTRPTHLHLEENFLTSEEVQKIANHINTLEYENAKVIDTNSGGDLDSKEVRSSKIKWVCDHPNINFLYDKTRDLILKVNENNWRFDLTTFPVCFQYTEYRAEDKGHYNWHMDVGQFEARYRKISLSILLNDPNKDYEGGDLMFNNSGEKEPSIAPRKKYSAILFPSFMLHRVAPVTKGVRRSLVLWVGGQPFR